MPNRFIIVRSSPYRVYMPKHEQCVWQESEKQSVKVKFVSLQLPHAPPFLPKYGFAGFRVAEWV